MSTHTHGAATLRDPIRIHLSVYNDGFYNDGVGNVCKSGYESLRAWWDVDFTKDLYICYARRTEQQPAQEGAYEIRYELTFGKIVSRHGTTTLPSDIDRIVDHTLKCDTDLWVWLEMEDRTP